MTERFGDQVLRVFDVPAHAYEFLAGVVDSRAAAPHDLKALFDESLIAGSESWYHELDHACTLDPRLSLPPPAGHPEQFLEEPWKATDQLIKRAKQLAEEASVCLLPVSLSASSTYKLQSRARTSDVSKRKGDATASHYWCKNGEGENSYLAAKRSTLSMLLSSTAIPNLHFPVKSRNSCLLACAYSEPHKEAAVPSPHNNTAVSPYFTSSDSKAGSEKRPAPGTVSCIPFPPLDADYFGIVQERVAHEPFWLLIVVTFLIKTNGQLAIPAFLRIKERFPTPSDIANTANATEIVKMIQHLGLSQNRLRFMQKYAEAFLFNPPKPGVRYAVRRYDSREAGSDDGEHAEDCPVSDTNDGWEIGHMTQGTYAIDSWRIFCRDVLLGRAQDWNGKGREAEFQPEWMRVLPADKELRAFLRWMWMREGWEWDPATGERTVLREIMRQAVNESRVKYDVDGGLRILMEE
ncbi:hypothetical protein NQ176_g3462 [Zarea fungicola]|uniref:Uncharacterized protein n=1 Tax=Zarea fungicola TaxID=93591 RepID=A0ACC1NIH1_9HYPO|nr:hypothetical protein NQ176_g3462 [Lecanicillium fungicola]